MLLGGDQWRGEQDCRSHAQHIPHRPAPSLTIEGEKLRRSFR
jgi:hypothetical protein